MSLTAASTRRLGRLITRVGESITVTEATPKNALGTDVDTGAPAPASEAFHGFYAQADKVRRPDTGQFDHVDTVYFTRAAIAAGTSIMALRTDQTITVRGERRTIRDLESWGGDPPAFFRVILNG